MRERKIMGLLKTALQNGWDIPEPAVSESLGLALKLIRDSSTSPRDRIRAAELVAGLAERRLTLLLGVAKLEQEIITSDRETSLEAIKDGAAWLLECDEAT